MALWQRTRLTKHSPDPVSPAEFQMSCHEAAFRERAGGVTALRVTVTLSRTPETNSKEKNGSVVLGSVDEGPGVWGLEEKQPSLRAPPGLLPSGVNTHIHSATDLHVVEPSQPVAW